MWDDSYTAVIEDTIQGFVIYIEPNPDQYRGGYVWSVSKDGEGLDTGLAFTVEDASNEVLKIIASLEGLNERFSID
jgi:hypothetical protein